MIQYFVIQFISCVLVDICKSGSRRTFGIMIVSYIYISCYLEPSSKAVLGCSVFLGDEAEAESITHASLCP